MHVVFRYIDLRRTNCSLRVRYRVSTKKLTKMVETFSYLDITFYTQYILQLFPFNILISTNSLPFFV